MWESRKAGVWYNGDMKAERDATRSWIGRANEVIATEIEAMKATAAAIGDDDGFAKAVQMADETLSNGGRIVLSGVGKNLPVAEKISATLSSTGSPSFVLNPVQALHGDLGMLCNNDLIVVMSFSGESEEVLKLLPILKARNLKTIAFTGRAASSLAHACDALLLVSTPAECDPFNMAPTASTTATMALGDALAMVLLDIRGFGRSDYARLHPAGAIGQALLTRAIDVMRSGDRLAALPPSATVKDAIAAMTRARAGAAYVVGPDGTLLGIFTDGDLRRTIAADGDALGRALSAVMTQNPVAIADDKMATDVLHVFRQRQIDDIPVVDAVGRLVGAIDISDLPKLKVM